MDQSDQDLDNPHCNCVACLVSLFIVLAFYPFTHSSIQRRYGCLDHVPLDTISSNEIMCLLFCKSDKNDELQNLTLPDQPLCLMHKEFEAQHGLGGYCYNSALNAIPDTAYLIKPHSSFDLWTIGYNVIHNISLVIDYDQPLSRNRSTPPLGTNAWYTYNGFYADGITYVNITMEECFLSDCYIEKEVYKVSPIIESFKYLLIGCAFVGVAAIVWTLGHWPVIAAF